MPLHQRLSRLIALIILVIMPPSAILMARPILRSPRPHHGAIFAVVVVLGVVNSPSSSRTRFLRDGGRLRSDRFRLRGRWRRLLRQVYRRREDRLLDCTGGRAVGATRI